MRKMIEFWEDIAEESGRLMHSLIQQVELIDFYLHKIEFYFSKKQDEDDDQDSNQPGKSGRSAGSDDDEITEEMMEQQRMSSIQEDADAED